MLRIVLVAAVALVAGMVLRGALDTPGTPASGRSTPSPAAEEPGVPGGVAGSEPGPSGEAAGVPVGFARSEAGAVAAAVNVTAAVSQRLLYRSDEEVAAAVAELAASGTEDAQVDDALARLGEVRPRLAAGSGPTWWVVAPLATRVLGFSEERATVSVWLVRVLAQTGVAVPQSTWATVTVELVWEEDDWRLWSTTERPGPTVVADGTDLPASAEQLNAALAQFTPHEPGRPSR